MRCLLEMLITCYGVLFRDWFLELLSILFGKKEIVGYTTGKRGLQKIKYSKEVRIAAGIWKLPLSEILKNDIGTNTNIDMDGNNSMGHMDYSDDIT